MLALTREAPSTEIALNRAVDEIVFLGHVCYNSLARKPAASFPELPFLFEGFPDQETPAPLKAYPHAGEFGELIGEYDLVYEDDQREIIPLKNGIHFADYRLFHGLSTIDSVATDTERAVHYRGDYGAKSYQLRLFAYHPEKPNEKDQVDRIQADQLGFRALVGGNHREEARGGLAARLS